MVKFNKGAKMKHTKKCRCRECEIDRLARGISDGMLMRKSSSYQKECQQGSEGVIEEALVGMKPMEVV